MRRLQAGIWGRFAAERWHELARGPINGMEVCMLLDEQEVKRFRISVPAISSDMACMGPSSIPLATNCPS